MVNFAPIVASLIVNDNARRRHESEQKSIRTESPDSDNYVYACHAINSDPDAVPVYRGDADKYDLEWVKYNRYMQNLGRPVVQNIPGHAPKENDPNIRKVMAEDESKWCQN